MSASVTHWQIQLASTRLRFQPSFSGSFTSYFYSEVLRHHAVSGRQISVDKLVGVEVSHAISDLPGHLKHLL